MQLQELKQRASGNVDEPLLSPGISQKHPLHVVMVSLLSLLFCVGDKMVTHFGLVDALLQYLELWTIITCPQLGFIFSLSLDPFDNQFDSRSVFFFC